MKLKLYISIVFFFLCNTAIQSQELKYVENWDKALQLSKTQQKRILLVFTASDWCKPCVKMKKNVFSNNNFINYVNSHFILHEIDMGKQPIKINGEKYQYYKKMSDKFDAKELPSLVLVDSKGKKIKKVNRRITSLKNVMSQIKI